MPYSVALDPEGRRVRTRCWGVLTDGDLRAYVAEIRGLFTAGTLDGDWAQFADFCAVTRFDVSPAALRTIARDNPWPARCRRVFVLPQDVGFGLARLFELTSAVAGANIRVFRSLEEGERWLGDDS